VLILIFVKSLQNILDACDQNLSHAENLIKWLLENGEDYPEELQSNFCNSSNNKMILLSARLCSMISPGGEYSSEYCGYCKRQRGSNETGKKNNYGMCQIY
jgi:hypothetical protein